MVLRSLIAAALVLLPACIHSPPSMRLPDPAPIVVALLLDRQDGPGATAVPAELAARVSARLAERNLIEHSLGDAADELGAGRNTQQRLSQLSRGAGEAPYLLLIEAKVSFFELLQGRYRWVVNARITVARTASLAAAASVDVEAPVYLTYEHEREPEALRAAADTLADRTGALLDGFLGSAEKSAQTGGGALYFVLVDRFANGDKLNDGAVDLRDPQAFHGGDLQGVLDHLDDLRALGATSVWLSPVFKMRTEKFFGYGAFHGYWTEDLNRVEPRFGDEALLRRLADELHQRGMRLYLDLVLNHVGPETTLTRTHPDWFHHQGSITDFGDTTQLESRDVSGLPDLAQENEDVYRTLLNASLGWIDRVHPDGFRLDAVKHIPLAFWSRFNRAVHEHAGPGFQLLGEALDGDPARLAKLQREGGFDALFDFPTGFALNDVYCKDQDPGKLAAILSLDRLYADSDALVTLLDDHDLPRVATSCGGDLGKVEQALTALIALRGTPALTYGTEAGLTGAKEPENRADMNWRAQPLRASIAGLLSLRRAHESLRTGKTRIVSLDGGLLLIARVAPRETALLAINRGTSERALPPGARNARTAALETAIAARSTALYFIPPIGLLTGVRAVQLRGSHAPLGPEDALVVVGAGPELGAWNPARGLPSGARTELPIGTVAEFKLAIRRKDGKVEWERGDDRFLFVTGPQGEALDIELEWRS